MKAHRVLVLCPKSVKAVWRDEIKKWSAGEECPGPFDEPWYISVCGAGDWRIANYDQIINKAHEKVLAAWGPDMLILDEAHRAKGIRTLRSLAGQRLAKNIPYRLALSGTPSHSPLDWLAQYRILDPTHPLWSQSFTRYRSRVAILGGPYGNWVQGFDPTGMAEALEATRPVTHVASKDVLNLLEPIETIIPVELDKDERAAYDRMKKELFIEFANGDLADATTVLTKILRLQQITSGFVSSTGGIRRIGTSKIDACMELLEERSQSQTVIACRFLEDIEALKARCGWTTNEDGSFNTWKKPVVITGGVSEKSRYWAQRNFQDGRANIAIVQPKAGGVGIDLSAASTLILFSAELSTIVWEQMLGRVWRPGQKGAVQVLPLVAERSVDSLIYNGLKYKMEATGLVKLLLEYLKRA